MLRAESPDVADLVASSAAFEAALQAELRRAYREQGTIEIRKMSDRLRSGTFATDVGMREGIAAGLRMEDVTTNGQTGVRIVSTGSGLPDERKPMVRAWQAQSWMHPVFGNTDVMVPQQGRPYMPRPEDGREQGTTATIAAMQRAATTLGD